MLLSITTSGKVVLLVVAGTFIVFAFVTAIVIPRSRPSFPGERLGAFIAVSAALFLAQMTAVVWVAETQEVEKKEAAEPGGTETGPSETTPAETTPTETTTTEAAAGNAAAGKQVFASAGCGGCHTLADAGSGGSVGPNLDQAKPPRDLVVNRVTNGKGVMPSFKGQLSEEQIQDVAAYVSSVAGQ